MSGALDSFLRIVVKRAGHEYQWQHKFSLLVLGIDYLGKIILYKPYILYCKNIFPTKNQ